jgi:hypothetical protein
VSSIVSAYLLVITAHVFFPHSCWSPQHQAVTGHLSRHSNLVMGTAKPSRPTILVASDHGDEDRETVEADNICDGTAMGTENTSRPNHLGDEDRETVECQQSL